jgi:hypothetical protein
MSSDAWKIVWFGVFCAVVIALAWAATSYLSSTTTSNPATRGAVTR